MKSVLNNMSRGFFYTIGRTLAFFVIGALIGLLIVKLGGN